jgi:hypothetical protein
MSLIKNLLVIDSRVTNWQALAAAATPDTTVLILDPATDGLTQISAYLSSLIAADAQTFTPLQSIQIMSHGSAGSISLGSSTLTTANLKQYTSQLATLGSALTATGDILLYGCNVAATPLGLDFINQFADLTNADVAASTDLTGATALGGNWVLEAATGAIQANLLSPAYNGLLLANNSPIGTVTISGVPAQDLTLYASNNITDADGLGAISYQWLMDNVAIAGATSSSFTLTAEQVGKTLSVQASYTDLLGTLEIVTSDPTGTVVLVGNSRLCLH